MSRTGIGKLNVLIYSFIMAISSCSAVAQTITVTNTAGKAMPGMVVYLINEHTSTALVNTPSKDPIEIHQYNKQFTPYVTVIQKGYQLQFVNDDDITHHIYSASGPKRFSFKLKQDDTQKQMLFDEAGHISMGCNIHDWMSGHVLVVDTPYFAVTNPQGQAELDGVPKGQYQMVIWHPQLMTTDNSVTETLSLPSKAAVAITIAAEMADIPTQQSLDDFEFLEGY
ncbi:hypothetical protein [Shewanella waksmanii]|uniref:hypothetical protein n=1 Tax=Shewanella waksmanii TaxID=213783 RepID=UPI003734D3AB